MFRDYRVPGVVDDPVQAYEKAKRSSNEWEYAHGFAQGIGAFKDALK